MLVDAHAELCRLMSLAEQIDVVDRPRGMGLPFDVARLHEQRMHHAVVCAVESLQEIVLTIVVHEEADGSLVHPVDRLRGSHETVERLEHQTVAAESYDDLGLVRRDARIAAG